MNTRTWVTRALALLCAAAVATTAASAAHAEGRDQDRRDNKVTLIARAVLPAASFAEGPPSGNYLGGTEFNGETAPFDSQPIQGVSAALKNGNGTYWLMSDNGYGALENSADYNLRVYKVRPDFEWANRGDGTIDVLRFVEFADPDGHIPWAIVNHFTDHRTLTGADFDIESIQIDRKGDFWVGDEFGPFLLHFNARGKLLEAPIPLPDFAEGGELRAPQNPNNEESSTVRVMNAVRTHAQLNGNTKAPVVSPWHVMIDDDNPDTFVETRKNAADYGLAPGIVGNPQHLEH